MGGRQRDAEGAILSCLRRALHEVGPVGLLPAVVRVAPYHRSEPQAGGGAESPADGAPGCALLPVRDCLAVMSRLPAGVAPVFRRALGLPVGSPCVVRCGGLDFTARAAREGPDGEPCVLCLSIRLYSGLVKEFLSGRSDATDRIEAEALAEQLADFSRFLDPPV